MASIRMLADRPRIMPMASSIADMAQPPLGGEFK
jgi:hypothetical protein